MYGGGINLDTVPGNQLSEEEKEICRKDREKLADLLLKIMVVQAIVVVANIAVGVAGILYYDSEDGMPFSVGNFICGGMLLLSLLGGYGLRTKAQNFKPEEKSTACLFLLLFEVPNTFSLTGAFLVIIFSVTSNTFSEKCSSASSFSFGCSSNPNHDTYKTVAIVAIVVVVITLMLAFAALVVLCTSPKAFATNKVAFNQPRMQTRHQAHTTMMVQQQMLLQQQLAMQQQMQNQSMGTHPAYPPAYPPPMGGPTAPPPSYNSMY